MSVRPWQGRGRGGSHVGTEREGGFHACSTQMGPELSPPTSPWVGTWGEWSLA